MNKRGKTLVFFAALFFAFGFGSVKLYASQPFVFPSVDWFFYQEITNKGLVPDEASKSDYVYVKGGQVYADFAGLPVFEHYPRLGKRDIIVYYPDGYDFYYYGHSEIEYSYKEKIIDYITADSVALRRYKDAIKAFGFTPVKNMEALIDLTNAEYSIFYEYFYNIYWALSVDPYFQLNKDGIYLVHDNDTFRLLLIGGSITNNAWGEMAECYEFRFYSLSNPLNYLDLTNLGKTFTYTPDAQGEIREISADNVTYLFR